MVEQTMIKSQRKRRKGFLSGPVGRPAEVRSRASLFIRLLRMANFKRRKTQRKEKKASLECCPIPTPDGHLALRWKLGNQPKRRYLPVDQLERCKSDPRN